MCVSARTNSMSDFQPSVGAEKMLENVWTKQSSDTLGQNAVVTCLREVVRGDQTQMRKFLVMAIPYRIT